MSLIDAKETLEEDGKVSVKRGAVTSSKYKWPTSTTDGKTVVLIPFVADSGMCQSANQPVIACYLVTLYHSC